MGSGMVGKTARRPRIFTWGDAPHRRAVDGMRRAVASRLMRNRIFYCIKPSGRGQFGLTPSLVGKGESQARVVRDGARAGELQLMEAPFVGFLRWAQGACWTA